MDFVQEWELEEGEMSCAEEGPKAGDDWLCGREISRKWLFSRSFMYRSEHRLRKSADIERLFKSGRSLLSPVFSLKMARNSLGITRVAIIVGTKVHKRAVRRNLVKRRMRAVMAELLPQLKPGIDLAISARSQALGLELPRMKEELFFLLKKAGL